MFYSSQLKAIGRTRMSWVDAWSSWDWSRDECFQQRVLCLWTCVRERSYSELGTQTRPQNIVCRVDVA